MNIFSFGLKYIDHSPHYLIIVTAAVFWSYKVTVRDLIIVNNSVASTKSLCLCCWEGNALLFSLLLFPFSSPHFLSPVSPFVPAAPTTEGTYMG